MSWTRKGWFRLTSLSKIKDPIRIVSLDGQSARLEGLAPHAAYEVVDPNNNPDLVWDPSTRDVISGGENVAHNADRDDLGIIIGHMAAITMLQIPCGEDAARDDDFPKRQFAWKRRTGRDRDPRFSGAISHPFQHRRRRDDSVDLAPRLQSAGHCEFRTANHFASS